MKKTRLNSLSGRKNKGQSLVELTLILVILLTLLTGMVEFGNLLNQYISVVDGAREGARFGSNDDPFQLHEDGTPHYETFFANIYITTQRAIKPIVLDPAMDDVVVTFYSVTQEDPITHVMPDPVPFTSHVGAGCPPDTGTLYCHYTSRIDKDQIKAMVEPTAPSSGVLVVEVFYNYRQILRLYTFLGLPDPILVHAYSIMPLSAAEPTPTPLP